MIKRRYSVRQAVEATGLEESEIRFYEQVFREFLTFSQLDTDKNEFTEDHIDLLGRIKQLIHKRGLSMFRFDWHGLPPSRQGNRRAAPMARP